MDINSKVSFIRNLYKISGDASEGITDIEADFTGFPIKKLTLNKQTITGLNLSLASEAICTGENPTCPNTNAISQNQCCITQRTYNGAIACTCECSYHISVCYNCYTVNMGPCDTRPCIGTLDCQKDL